MANAAFLRLHKHHVLRPISSFCITVSDKTPPLKVIYKEEKKNWILGLYDNISPIICFYFFFVCFGIDYQVTYPYLWVHPMNKLWVNLFDREFNKVIFSTLVKWRPVWKSNFETLININFKAWNSRGFIQPYTLLLFQVCESRVSYHVFTLTWGHKLRGNLAWLGGDYWKC